MDNTSSPINGFHKIIEILNIILDKIDVNTDVVWTHFNTIDELEDDLLMDIEKLRSNRYEVLGKIHGDFLPTATYQELAMTNGWGEECLVLARRFDAIYFELRQKTHL